MSRTVLTPRAAGFSQALVDLLGDALEELDDREIDGLLDFGLLVAGHLGCAGLGTRSRQAKRGGRDGGDVPVRPVWRPDPRPRLSAHPLAGPQAEYLRDMPRADRSRRRPSGAGSHGVEASGVNVLRLPAAIAPLEIVRGGEVEMRPIRWLEKPLLQDSAFTLLAGRKGCGKGTYVAKIAAKLTCGTFGEPRDVVFISSEDSAAIDLIPRLRAAGADLDRIRIVKDHVVLPRDLDALQETVRAIGNVGLVVVDPLGNHLGGVDTDKEGPVRNAIAGLNRLADEFACAVMGVRHLAKVASNGSLAAVLGSTAWVDLPRQVNVFARDDEDPMVFHVQVAAGNRSANGQGRSFQLELHRVRGLGEPVTYAAELGTSTKDVDELLAAPRRTSKSRAARDLILDLLEAEGTQESDTLDARVALQTGLNARTVQNQRVALKDQGLVRNIPVKDEQGQVTCWKIARTGAPRP
jgi:hypothetical protein